MSTEPTDPACLAWPPLSMSWPPRPPRRMCDQKACLEGGKSFVPTSCFNNVGPPERPKLIQSPLHSTRPKICRAQTSTKITRREGIGGLRGCAPPGLVCIVPLVQSRRCSSFHPIPFHPTSKKPWPPRRRSPSSRPRRSRCVVLLSFEYARGFHVAASWKVGLRWTK